MPAYIEFLMFSQWLKHESNRIYVFCSPFDNSYEEEKQSSSDT